MNISSSPLLPIEDVFNPARFVFLRLVVRVSVHISRDRDAGVPARRKAARTPGERLQEEILSLYALDPGERVLLTQAGAVLNTLTE